MLHEPVPADTAAKLGHPRCAFVTGGPREYLAGLNCVSHRLQVLGSQHPLLIMVEPEDEAFMQRHVVVNSHPSSIVLPWVRFPEKTNRSGSWRYRGGHVMDKVKLFGMPFRRLVWIDADVFIRRNVDELCDLPEEVHLATAFDAEGMPTKCWPNARGTCKNNCANEYKLAVDALPFAALRAHEMRPTPASCPLIFNTGVMMLRPFNLSTFNALFVDPVRAGTVASYDSTDQGIINTLLYKGRLFGPQHEHFARLHPMYNVIARHAKHTEHKWRLPNSLPNLTAVLLHFTRETRPWQSPPQVNNVTRAAEWTYGCGRAVCGSLMAKRLLLNEKKSWAAAMEGYKPPPSVGIHADWEPYCGLSRNSTSSHGNGNRSLHLALGPHSNRSSHGNGNRSLHLALGPHSNRSSHLARGARSNRSSHLLASNRSSMAFSGGDLTRHSKLYEVDLMPV